MEKAHLTREGRKEAKDLAHKYASYIIKQSLEENKNPVMEMLDNLAGLVVFLREFLLNPQAKPVESRPVTRSLMEEIRECVPVKKEEQVLFLLSAIRVYTDVLSFLERDILPFISCRQ